MTSRQSRRGRSSGSRLAPFDRRALSCAAPAPIVGTGAAKRSFKFDRLVFSGFVELRSPDLVRSLVLAAADTERYATTKIANSRLLHNLDQPPPPPPPAAALQRADQHLSRNEHPPRA